MAATATGTALTQRHRRQQLAVGAMALQRLLVLRRGLDLDNLRDTWEPFEEGLVANIKLHRRYSAAIASNYYRNFRTTEGVPGTAAPKLVTEVNEPALRGSLRFAGPHTAQKVARYRPTDVAGQLLTSLSGTTSRHVMDAGRGTMMEAVRDDPRAQGYVRVTAGGCSFCQMLGARGPTYTEEGSSFEAHNNCGCTAEPYFGGGFDTWPKTAQDSHALWNESTQGLSSGDARLAFRRAVEGR